MIWGGFIIIIFCVNSIAALIYYITFVKISHTNFKWLETLIAVALLATATMIFFLHNEVLTWFTPIATHVSKILIMSFMANRKIKIAQLSVVYGIISSIILMLAGYTSGVVFRFIFGPVQDMFYIDDIAEAALYLAVVASLAFIISRWLGVFLFKKTRSFDDELKKRFAGHVLFGLIVILLLYFVKVFMRSILTEADLLGMVYAAALIVYFVVLFFTVFAFTDNIRQKAEIVRHKETLANLQTYTKDVENMANEVRRFRHDHRNLLIGFQSYIEKKDMEGVSDYYDKYFSTFAAETDIADSMLNKLSHIKSPEAKSIISAKLQFARQLNIAVHIEISDDIEGIGDFQVIDLCRIFGILLDNAIEACQTVKKPVFKFLVIKEDIGFFFVFANTYPSPAPVISQIFEEGYTTKKGKRGLGLSVLSLLCNRSGKISLRKSHIVDDCFVQELYVIPDPASL